MRGRCCHVATAVVGCCIGADELVVFEWKISYRMIRIIVLIKSRLVMSSVDVVGWRRGMVQQWRIWWYIVIMQFMFLTFRTIPNVMLPMFHCFLILRGLIVLFIMDIFKSKWRPSPSPSSGDINDKYAYSALCACLYVSCICIHGKVVWDWCCWMKHCVIDNVRDSRFPHGGGCRKRINVRFWIGIPW